MLSVAVQTKSSAEFRLAQLSELLQGGHLVRLPGHERAQALEVAPVRTGKNGSGPRPQWSGTALPDDAGGCYLMVIVPVALVLPSEPVAVTVVGPVVVPTGMTTVTLALPLTSVSTEVELAP